jgi:hypothetical protein
MRFQSFRKLFAPCHRGQFLRAEVETIAHLINCEQQAAGSKPPGIIKGLRSARSFGKTMREPIASMLVLVFLCCAFPARAAETAPIQCGANEDRVWVYDSLDSFDVSMKLKCGEQVEILGRQKGYVKIRTSSGKEGYVPEKALPKPPETEEDNQNPGQAQSSSQEGPQSIAAAARAKGSTGSASGSAAKPVQPAATSVNQTKSTAGAPASAEAASEATNSAAQTTGSPAETNSSTAAATDANNQEKAKPKPIPAHSQTKPVAHPSASSTTKPADSENADSNSASGSQGKTKSSSSSPAPASTKGAATKTSSSKPVSVSDATAAVSTSAPSAPSKIELADNQPSEPTASNGSAHAAASPRDPDEEEEPAMKPLENKEACKIYFSAYGLSPNQYKWMTRNRGKSFPGICPAPAPAMVDFVVIFTHDADFYNGTMPTPVHTDKNGFSDFTPLTTVDTAVVSLSDADKNRREYVWVFHTKRGTFDPAKFSPKRRPLFSTTEANKLGTAAGGRSAEDALRFIEQHGVDR